VVEEEPWPSTGLVKGYSETKEPFLQCKEALKKDIDSLYPGYQGLLRM
jgi:hypothetical protein